MHSALDPDAIAKWLDSLTPEQLRRPKYRKVLSAAGRAASRSRTERQIIAGPGRPRTKPHDPNAPQCWCVECRSKFPSYRKPKG